MSESPKPKINILEIFTTLLLIAIIALIINVLNKTKPIKINVNVISNETETIVEDDDEFDNNGNFIRRVDHGDIVVATYTDVEEFLIDRSETGFTKEQLINKNKKPEVKKPEVKKKP